MDSLLPLAVLQDLSDLSLLVVCSMQGPKQDISVCLFGLWGLGLLLALLKYGGSEIILDNHHLVPSYSFFFEIYDAGELP